MLSSSFAAIVPLVCVCLAAIAAMLAEAFRAKDERMPIGALGVIGLGFAIVGCVLLWGRNASSFGGTVLADNFGLFICITLGIVGLVTIALSGPSIERDRLPAGEYYSLMLFAVAGMMLMAIATDLLLIFLALEILSLAIYVLTGLRRDDPTSTEGAFKYFLLGAFSSAFFLYGVAIAYTLTGSTRLDRLASYLAGAGTTANPLVFVALGLLLVGFAFKISAVPFHMWTPDAYEGAPTIVTGFMSTGVKAAAFAAFARVFLTALGSLGADWSEVLRVIALATMILGTVVGVAQSNLKRMLAYSSIAHGGYLIVALVAANSGNAAAVGKASILFYLLVALAAGDQVGRASILFYLVVYAVTNLGAFAVLALVGSREAPMENLDDFKGLWHSSPAMAGLLTIFLLSLGGFPPTAGFVAKWYVFSAAVRAGQFSLAIIGVLTSVVSVFFYLRIVVMMYMTEKREPEAMPTVPGPALAALSLSVVVLFYLGVLPTRVLDLAARSVASMF
jgi:NADH-quinone oxidoreductase subunit N